MAGLGSLSGVVDWERAQRGLFLANRKHNPSVDCRRARVGHMAYRRPLQWPRIDRVEDWRLHEPNSDSGDGHVDSRDVCCHELFRSLIEAIATTQMLDVLSD
jgi:hypothetical protein